MWEIRYASALAIILLISLFTLQSVSAFFDECDNDIGYSYGTPWPYTTNPHTCLSGKSDCCGWYIQTHVHDLGQILDGTYDIYVYYRPGFNEGCTDTVKVYVSEDNQTWTQIASKSVKAHDMDGDGHYPQVWQEGVLNIENYTGRFRWVKVRIPYCFNDYSSVAVANASNNPPIAGFTVNASEGKPPLTIAFNASDSYDPDGDPLSYSWRFGEKWSARANGQTAVYTYNNTGTYTVQLTVEDPSGAKAVAFADIIVTDNPAEKYLNITSLSCNEVNGINYCLPNFTMNYSGNYDYYEVGIDSSYTDNGQNLSYAFENVNEGNHTVCVRGMPEAVSYTHLTLPTN